MEPAVNSIPCVCVCVRACVCACVRACVRACVCGERERLLVCLYTRVINDVSLYILLVYDAL